MLIAHLPAGYITARVVGVQSGWPLAAALLGSVLPDIDMVWFHLVDHGAVHHHRYWVHAPGFWAISAVVALVVLRGQARWTAILVFTAVFGHLVLVSIGGGIMWLWPFSDRLFSLIEVPATQSHWVLSFILHWSFAAELAVIGLALQLFMTRKAAS